MQDVRASRMRMPTREGTGLSPAQYKVYLWLMAHARQGGKDCYLAMDEPDEFRGVGIARSCGVSPESVKTILRAIRDKGAMEQVGKIGVRGGVLHMPEVRGAAYAEVDCRGLMRCFTFGAPFKAAEAYVALTEPSDLGVPGMTQYWGEDAIGWLEDNGLAAESLVERDGFTHRWVYSLKTA